MCNSVPLRLWYRQSAPCVNEFMPKWINAKNAPDGWEKWSLPIGNGYMGANVFGRTDVERIQITENSLCNPGKGGGLNSFAEVMIRLDHENVENYERELCLDDAIARVKYDCGGVSYSREVFASYPDRVMVIQLTASKPGALSFTLNPFIPFIKQSEEGYSKSGEVKAEGNLITMTGRMDFYAIDFEGQFIVLNEGGKLNAHDGMIAVYGSDLRVEKKTLSIGEDYEDVRFAVLCRHAERIWGTGAPGYPDDVFYSRPYDPFDWTGVQDTPELGGGVIRQPTWDGDAFIALEPFGGYMLAIKPGTVFEVRGSDPSSFTITEAYGTDGPVQARSICVDRLRMFFLTQTGLGLYDGSTLSLLSRDALHETMRMRMEGSEHLATACVAGHVYYLALCVKESEGDVLSANNTVIEFDTERGTFMIRKGIRVRDFFSFGGKVYFTQADAPYEVLRYNDPDAGGYMDMPMQCVWETPWLDLGKDRVKRDFVLRFTADAAENDVPIELTIATDRREKSRIVLLHSRRKDYRVKIQLAGVRVRLRIKSSARASAWRILGGVQVEYTFDEE